MTQTPSGAPALVPVHHSRLAPLRRRAEPGGREPGSRGPGRERLSRTRLFVERRVELLITALAGAVFAWRLGQPSAWWDEAVTRDVVTRPADDMLALLGSIDLVHAGYYLGVRGLLGPDPSITAIRVLSVLAAAATAAVLVRIGRELGSLPVGITAGLLWIIAPLATRYAQEARPYAAVTLAAAVATLALLRACRKPWLPARWVQYGALLVTVGVLNVLALLIVPVHLVHVLATAPQAVRRRWYGVVGITVLLLVPLLVATASQRGQVSWLPSPRLDQLTGFLDAQYTVGPLVAGLVVLATLGMRRGTHTGALWLGLTWALLPPVLLWTVSQVQPLYDWRYVVFAVPGTALALASLTPLLRPLGTAAMIVVLAVAGLHMQHVYRLPATGHAEDLRGAAETVGSGARTGDAVLFLPATRRVVKLGYPEQFTDVDDVALAQDPLSSATLFGIEVPANNMAAALGDRSRIWVVTGPSRLGDGDTPAEHEKERLLANGYSLSWVDATKQFEVRLYVRKPVVVPSAGLTRSPA